MALAVGTRLGRYRIDRLIGSGGMGEVYRGHDEKLGRTVAIKVLTRTADPTSWYRFRREGQAGALLNHPHICAVYDVGEEADTAFLVMEYLAGETLAHRLNRGALPVTDACDYAAQMADALRVAHSAGVLHRDVKPSNVMVVNTGIKLLDFGVSKVTMTSTAATEASDSNLAQERTMPGMLIGTLPYMAPEQLTGDHVDHRADIYAFGAVLYEMVTGRALFESGEREALMRAILSDEPRRLFPVQSDLPPALQEIVRRCLAKEAAARWRSFDEILPALRGLHPKSTRKEPRRRSSTRSAVGRRRIRSVAVLPFRHVNMPADQEYLAEGLMELLISRVATITGLRVISRTSAMQYRDSNETLPTIAEKLKVDAIIEGSVLRVADRVRITAHLIDATSDSTLWADAYDRALDDVLAIQSEIADEISKHVSVTLSPSERHALRDWARVSGDAQDAYLRARFLWNKHDAQSLEKSFEFYATALTLAPDYPLVHAGMADWYHFAALSRLLPAHEAFKKGRAAAERALVLDPRLGEARASLARIKHLEWDWPGAEQEFQRVIKHNPSCFNARMWYSAYLSHCARHGEAVEQVHQAAALDPLNPRVYENLAFRHFAARDFDAVVAEALRVTEMQVDSAPTYYVQGLALSHLQRWAEALAAFDLAARYSHDHPSTLVGRAACLWRAGRQAEAEQTMAFIEHSSASAYDRAEAFAACDQPDQALTFLEVAVEQRLPELVAVAVEPLFDSVRLHPRFQRVLGSVGIPCLTAPERPAGGH